jgi:PAS domain S-box-containing protein
MATIENLNSSETSFKPPVILLVFTVVISIGPFFLNLIGFDFASSKIPFLGEASAGMSPSEIIDGMFRTLSGAFTHTILEWSAFSAAFFTVILSFAHFAIKRDVSTPILGVALFCAGCMDAFHTLAADRLIQSVADTRILLPFTWAICRMFNAMILIGGISLLIFGNYKDRKGNFLFVITVSMVFGFIAYGIIHYCATSSILPNTMFPESLLIRPWDVGPLVLYLFAGLYVVPRFYKINKNFVSYSILISIIPHIATQLHMAFGSSSLFDNHFNIAHFLKVIAYLIPFLGLTLEYIKTYQDQQVSEVMTRTIIESTQEAVVVINSEGFVTVFNQSAEKMFGYSADEVIGQNVKILMPEPFYSEHDGYLLKHFRSDQKNIIGATREWNARRKDETLFPMELGVNEMVLGERNFYVGNIRDISERKTSEKNLLQAKLTAEAAREEAESANQAKSTFLANMSHEIRTPMNAILGYSQILLRRKDIDLDQRKALQTIDSSGKNLMDLINEILDISKIEAGKMDLNLANFDLKELTAGISHMFELRCQQKSLGFKVRGLKKVRIVFGDELKLRAILVNLIGNAVKFTEEGEVEFLTTPLENGRILFEIIDTGRGIAAKDQQHILEPFHQEESGSKMGGTGLGLAISNKQLELMGTELKLESELGKGSRFYFTLSLPKGTGEVVQRGEKTENILCLAKGCHVKALIVDDIKGNRDVLSQFLMGLNVEIIEAVNGQDGLEKAREHLPDIIFMDIRMPVMDGKEAIKEIQKEFGNDRFKIVVITASAFDHDRERFMGMGVQEFITKPFRSEQIIQCLDELLDVEFEYDQEVLVEQEPSNLKELDYSKISLPQDLLSQIKEAAELYNVTQMEMLINKFQSRDEGCKQLAVHFEDLLSRYDMAQINEIVEKLIHNNK